MCFCLLCAIFGETIQIAFLLIIDREHFKDEIDFAATSNTDGAVWW
jgi:hypothetical protein